MQIRNIANNDANIDIFITLKNKGYVQVIKKPLAPLVAQI